MMIENTLLTKSTDPLSIERMFEMYNSITKEEVSKVVSGFMAKDLDEEAYCVLPEYALKIFVLYSRFSRLHNETCKFWRSESKRLKETLLSSESEKEEAEKLHQLCHLKEEYEQKSALFYDYWSIIFKDLGGWACTFHNRHENTGGVDCVNAFKVCKDRENDQIVLVIMPKDQALQIDRAEARG